MTIVGLNHSYRSINGVKARLIERIGNLNPNLRDELRNIKLDWYAIKNVDGEGDSEGSDSKARNPEILIYEEIGGSFGVDAQDFIKELNDIESDEIDIRINSPGGSVFDAIAIYNAIVRHPAHITTYVDAMAASAASVVAMAGDEVVMMVGSQMMIHDALSGDMTNAKGFRELADWLDKQSDNIAGIYAVKGGGDAEQWRKMMIAETWMMADEAVELKLADRVFVRPTIESESTVEDEPASTEDTDEESIVEADVEAAMHKRHRLTNRGYKYTGREKAPDPLASIVDSWGPKNVMNTVAGNGSFVDLMKW
jgi:ATP-dependent protease ClpP protease subunit